MSTWWYGWTFYQFKRLLACGIGVRSRRGLSIWVVYAKWVNKSLRNYHREDWPEDRISHWSNSKGLFLAEHRSEAVPAGSPSESAIIEILLWSKYKDYWPDDNNSRLMNLYGLLVVGLGSEQMTAGPPSESSVMNEIFYWLIQGRLAWWNDFTWNQFKWLVAGRAWVKNDSRRLSMRLWYMRFCGALKRCWHMYFEPT